MRFLFTKMTVTTNAAITTTMHATRIRTYPHIGIINVTPGIHTMKIPVLSVSVIMYLPYPLAESFVKLRTQPKPSYFNFKFVISMNCDSSRTFASISVGVAYQAIYQGCYARAIHTNGFANRENTLTSGY